MIFLKPILLFSVTALVLAVSVDLACIVTARITGNWVGDFATRSGWVVIFASLWGLAFLIGVLIARMIHLFPFLPRVKG